VKRAAEARGLRVFTPEKLKPFVDQARSLGADAFVVASYGKIVPQMLLDLVDIAFNVHPSLLPLYRGATPLQSAIHDGRTQTGLSIIAMDAGMDTGDVLVQELAEIGPDETYGELHDRLAKRGAALAVTAVERYANGTLERTPQSAIARELGVSDDEIARTLTRPLTKDDLVIDWTRTARQVVDHVRSLSPMPAARTTAPSGETIKVLRAHVSSEEDGIVRGAEPGVVVPRTSGGMPATASRAGDGRDVVLDVVVPPGRRAMSGTEYAQSHRARTS
jgi:methionyl-tRNA formyltransferase